LLALALAGCGVYSTKPVPAIAEPPAGKKRLFVVVVDDGWSSAARLAGELEWAGFEPEVVPDAGAVPADAPLAALPTEPAGDSPGCDWSLLLYLPGPLTLGVIPWHDCYELGHRLDVRRTPGAPVQHVDTRYGVDTWHGWLVLPLALFPQWSISSPPGFDYERERRALRAAVLEALR